MLPLKQAIYSSRTADKFVVRLPDGMRERIAEVALLAREALARRLATREWCIEDRDQLRIDRDVVRVPRLRARRRNVAGEGECEDRRVHGCAYRGHRRRLRTIWTIS